MIFMSAKRIACLALTLHVVIFSTITISSSAFLVPAPNGRSSQTLGTKNQITSTLSRSITTLRDDSFSNVFTARLIPEEGAKITFTSRIIQSSSSRLCAKARMDDEEEESLGRDQNPDMKDEKTLEERMDLAGFGGYLAPYALALILSIGVTGAFFKFVLMDY